MAISYSKPTINTVVPEPPINKTEADRIRAANDAKVQVIADAVDSLVTVSNADTLNVPTLAGKTFADEAGAVAGTAGKATATLTSDTTNMNIAATGKLTTDATVPVDQSLVTIGATVYKFVTGAPAAEGDVLVEATVADTLTNWNNAIAADATSKTAGKHFCVVAHPLVTASVSATVLTLTAKLRGTIGNAYALVAGTSPNSHFTVSAATMGTGAGCTLGVDHTITVGTKVYKFVPVIGTTEGNVLYGASTAASLDNFKEAVNSTGPTATQYCAAAHPTVEATDNTNTTQVLLARTAGAAGNLIALATNFASLSFNGGTAFLRGGYQASGAQINANAGPVILNSISVSAISSGASVLGLTAGSWYKYAVLTPVTATYGSAVSGTGTGTAIMALTASADLLLMVFPIA